MDKAVLSVLTAIPSKKECLRALKELRAGGFSPIATPIDSGKSLKKNLSKRKRDLVIVDADDPAIKWRELLMAVFDVGADTPIVLLTDRDDPSFANNAVLEGAFDVISKYRMHALVPTVHRAQRTLSLQHSLKREVEERGSLAKALSITSGITKVISGKAPRTVLLDDACRLLASDYGFDSSWGGFADPAKGRIVPLAFHGRENGIFKDLCLKCGHIRLDDGLAGKAIASGEPAISSKLRHGATNDGAPPCAEVDARASSGVCAFFPVNTKTGLAGAFNVFSRDPKALSPHLVSALALASISLGQAINASFEDSARKTAIKRQVASERRLAGILDNMPIGIATYSLEGRIIGANKALIKLLGYGSKDDFLRAPPDAHYLNPETRLSMAERAWSTDHAEHEFIARRKDGGAILVSSATVARTTNAGATRLIGVIEDVTAKRVGDAALKESEARLRTIFESTMDAIFILDRSCGIEDANEAACALFGYRKDELVSADLRILFYAEDFGSRYEKLIGAPGDGVLLPDVLMRKKDGSCVWADLNVTRFAVNGRDLTLFVARDVTNKKRFEEALKESEERFRQIFHQSDAPTLLIDPVYGSVNEANDAAARLYEYSISELINSGVGLIMARDELARFNEALQKAVSEGGFSIERMTTSRKTGAKVFVSLRAKLIRLKSRQLVYCTITDVTEMVRSREEARILLTKLVQSSKMASIGTLASGVAHEINNPNNFILFNSSLLADAWADAVKVIEKEAKKDSALTLGGLPFVEMRTVIPELISGIANGSRRIKSIVDGLKDFARKDKDGLDNLFDVNRVVLAATSILAVQISKHTDSFRVNCADSLPQVKGSAQRIEQVLINLVVNSLQSLPDRKRGVVVSTSRGNDDTVVITVSDEGVGMAKEVLSRVSEPFFTTKHEKGGTGLGLSISYSIIKEHGGMLSFSSEPGKGTVATITLPSASRATKCA